MNKKNFSLKKGVHQSGDPLGRMDLGKATVKWIQQVMRAMGWWREDGGRCWD